MKPLYEYSNDYKKLIDELEQNDELTIEQQKELLDSVKENIENKSINVGAYIKNMEIEQDAILNHIKQMNDRLKKVTRRIENMKDYLKYNMQSCNIDKIVSSKFNICIKNNPCKVVISDETQVEDIYIKEKVTKSIDKELIKSHLKNGLLLDYATLVTDKRIEIK